MAVTEIPPYARDLARTVVIQAAPKELVLFDQIWDDFLGDPDLSRPVGEAGHAEGPHGGGFGDLGMILLSTIIIPVVVRVISDKSSKALDVVIQHVRDVSTPKKANHSTPALDDRQIRQIAEVILKVLQSHEPDANHGESTRPGPDAKAADCSQ